MTIERWLEGLGLERYADTFKVNDIDLDLVASLKPEDLDALGIRSVGHRRRLLDAAARLAASGAEASTGAAHAERRQLTVLFVDLVGSTALSARFDPEDARDAIRAFQDAAAGEISRFGGYIAKFMGDALLAYFGWPRASEDAAEQAVRAGLAASDAVARLKAADGTSLAARVGIATGLVVVGDLVGAGAAREESVIGETPNIAARLQQMAEPGAVIIGNITRRLIGGQFDLDDLGWLTVKGYDAPLKAFRVLGERSHESRFIARHGEGAAGPIAREAALERLVALWHRTIAERRNTLVIVAGEPGIGKSRLVQAFQERIAEAPYARAAMQCSPHYARTALYPVIRTVGMRCGFRPSDSLEVKREKLEAYLEPGPTDPLHKAAFGRLLSVPLASDHLLKGLTPEKLGELQMEALMARVATFITATPTLYILEDVHWIDPSTLALARRTLATEAPHGVMVLATCRPELGQPFGPVPEDHIIDLDRLDRPASTALVEHIAGSTTLPAAIVAEIVERAEGVPLFLEEITRSVVACGSAEAIAETARSHVPATLHDSLLARLDRDPRMKEVLQIASVIGREFSQQVLAALTPMPPAELQRLLDRMIGHDLVVLRRRAPERIHAFRHALLHDITYGTLLKAERSAWHRRLAHALRDRFPTLAEIHTERLAWHFRQGGEPLEAAVHYLEASRKSLDQGAFSEARAHIEAGLETVAEAPPSRRRLERELALEMARAETLRATDCLGDGAAQAACERARALATRLDAAEELLAVLGLELALGFGAAEAPTVTRAGHDLLALAERKGLAEAKALGLQALGCLAFFHGRLAEARERLEEALALAPALARPGLVADRHFPALARLYLARTRILEGDEAAGRRLLNEALAEAEAMPAWTHSLALKTAAVQVHLLEDDAMLEGLIVRGERLAAEAGLPARCELCGFHSGWIEARHRSQETGIARMQDNLARLIAQGHALEWPYLATQLAGLLIEHDRLDEAAAIVAEGLATLERTGERWPAPELHRLEAAIARRRGAAEASLILETARRAAAEMAAPFWLGRIQADAATLPANSDAPPGTAAEQAG